MSMSFAFHADASPLKGDALQQAPSFQTLPSFTFATNPISISPPTLAGIQGLSSKSFHRRAYSDTWAFLGQPSDNPGSLPWQACDQDNFPIPAPELQGMEVDPVGQQQQQQQATATAQEPSQGWSNSMPQLPGLTGTRTSSGRLMHAHANLGASLPLPTTLRGFAEVKQEPAPPLSMDAMPSLPPLEDLRRDENGRLLEGLDLPAPPPPPASLGALQNTHNQGSLMGKAGGPATKLRVQKNTSMKRASSTMHGRSDQELMMLDPKNVKRILANRQSAAKSKERRLQHAIELEHKLAAAQEEFDQVSVQVQELQLDNTTLTQYNEELLATVPQLQAQIQQLTSTSKLLVEEVLQAQRMLGLPLNVPDAAPAAEGDVLPLPNLLQPLSQF